MREEAEAVKASILDDEEVVKKRGCNTKQRLTFTCDTTREGSERERGSLF